MATVNYLIIRLGKCGGDDSLGEDLQTRNMKALEESMLSYCEIEDWGSMFIGSIFTESIFIASIAESIFVESIIAVCLFLYR